MDEDGLETEIKGMMMIMANLNDYQDPKKELRQFIFQEIKSKKNLNDIKNNVKEKLNKTLNNLENIYIEKKFLKYCVQFWLDDIRHLVTTAINNKRSQDILLSIHHIKRIEDVPELFQTSDYYTILNSHSALVHESLEKVLIHKINLICLELILKYNAAAKKELEFIVYLSSYLDTNYNNQNILSKLDLKGFISGKVSFEILLNSIIKLTEIKPVNSEATTLIKSAESLLKEKEYILIKRVEEIITDFLKPVEVHEKVIDGRIIIEIKSRNLKISEILDNIESRIKENNNIEEIQFIIAKSLYIDKDLKQDIWHGKNIGILTRNIYVIKDVSWDVSGNNNEHKFETDAGTDHDGRGKDGSDGYPGESGGNVVISATDIFNQNFLSIHSNGGNGSDGQNGGNGFHGLDGVGINTSEFRKKFPSLIKFAMPMWERVRRVKQMVNDIKELASTTHTEWYTDNRYPGGRDVFLEVTTSQGNHITFSYCRAAPFSTNYQGFLLYKGSLGKPGKPGGKNGLGGEGGFPGVIEVKNSQNQKYFEIQKDLSKGTVGKSGKIGNHGKHGKNSWDMGYIDYQFWSDTVVHTSKENNINIVYHEYSNANAVWCPYKYECGGYPYATMEVQKITHPHQITYENEQRTEANNDRQQPSKAIRKKNVLASNLHYDFNIIDLAESNKFENLNSQFKEIDLLTTQVFSEYDYNQKHDHSSVHSNINRLFNYSNESKQKYDQKQLFVSKYDILKANIVKSIPSNIINITDAETFIREASHLKKTTLNLQNLNLIYKIWTDCKFTLQQLNDCKIVEFIFVEKYKIAVLQEIAQKVSVFEDNYTICNKKDTNNKVSANQAVKYLSSQNKKNTNIYHDELGSLRQYIFDKEKIYCANIIEFIKNGFLQRNREIFGHVFSKYFLELSERDIKENDIKRYYDDYHLFLKDKKQKIITHYNIFKNELFKFRNKGTLQTIISNTIDHDTGEIIKKEIENDPFSQILYKRLNKQFQSTYDWKNCSQNKKICNGFYNFIKSHGPQARCYRELLAYIYHINIRVYYVNNRNEFILLDNHNNSSNNVVYFSYINETFSELDINSEHLNLNRKRELLDTIYFRILADLYPLKSTKTVLEYFERFDVTLVTPNGMPNEIIQGNSNEEKEIEYISKFFRKGDRDLIKSSLQKIASNLIGHLGLIHIMLQRFQNEGRYVSVQEIRYLVNFVLFSHLNNDKQENTISWIIATVNQSNWMAELILIELESFFMTVLEEKKKLKMYLTKLNPDILIIFGVKLYKYKQQHISLSSLYIEDTLYLLSSIDNVYINLDNVELSEWLYALKEHYWINKIENLFDWEQSELDSVAYYVLSLENMFGMSVVSEFLVILSEKNMRQLDINTFESILQNFVDERWNLDEEELHQLRIADNLEVWVKYLDSKFYAADTNRDARQLVNLIKGNSNTSFDLLQYLPDILNSLSSEKSEYNFFGKIYRYLQIFQKKMSESDIRNYVKQYKISKENINYQQLLEVINRAIELKKGFQLRDTQKLTIMSLLMNKNSTLAQVTTGEGKSLIIVAISIMKALNDEKVDIITSSSVLAIRDANINRDIYDLFDITVGHNCSEVIKNRKESYSSCNVIYGNLSNFQRDYLLDRFYGENVLGDHDFSNIIVDEVDSMLLDKGNNILYLSHDIAGLDKLESIYIYIWCSVNQPLQDATNPSDFMNVSKLKETIINDMYGILKKSDIAKLDEKLNKLQKTAIWNFLVSNKIIESSGRLILHKISDVNLHNISTDLIYLKERIIYMLRECIERQRFIYVPKYLYHFIEKHLETWINSAFTAYFMKVGHDYVVDVDRTKTISDGNPIITIIDKATGTDEISSQWDSALHQFLQLKHGCKLTMQSLKSVFISNVSYFKLYGKLYGLTGTLGSERERNLLKEVHMVDFLTVPTTKSKKFHEYVPIVCKNREIWINCIHEEIMKTVNNEARSILIICQYVRDVEDIESNLTNKGIKRIHTYTRDYEEFHFAQGCQKLEQRQIIIATNLAGRGTDIILSDTLKKKGGLHVCLTYLPTNTRIEKQAFGRAARCGDKGTGRLIIIDENYQGGLTSKVLNIKKERDAEELNRISSINVEYNNKIKIEEQCFDKFKTLFEKIKNLLNDVKIPSEVESILLQCFLDKWAFWLDEKNSDALTSDFDYSNLYKAFQIFYDRLENLTSDISSGGLNNFNRLKCFDLVKEYPMKMIILGKYFLTINSFDLALVFFDAVIEKEDIFSEAAHYYKAFTISKQIDWEEYELTSESKEKRKMFKLELLKSARLFQDHAERALYNATLVDKIKENYPNSIIQIQAYTQQQHTLSNFYYMFIKSIDDILGSPVASNNFTNNDINKPLALDVYENLLKEGLLNQRKIKKGIRELELQSICRDFGITSKALHNFLVNYYGQYFDVKVFTKNLKKNIHLPSCNSFWKMLLEQRILVSEVKYVIINLEMLKEIDLSFLITLRGKILSRGILIPNTDITVADDKDSTIVFFNGICIKDQMNENNIILYKNDLKSFNLAKFLMLKRKGVLSFNKMALIDKNKVSTANFSQYDSITLEDFSKINISQELSMEILSELISENIIERKESHKNQFIYKLKIPYENIFELKLKSKEMYKNNVIGLLLSCFTYRIAIQKLQKRLTQKQQNIRFQLMTKPHYSLINELIEQRIIKDVKVTNKKVITEVCIKNIFGFPITKEKFIYLLENSEIIPEDKASALFDDLLRAKWIQHYNTFGQLVQGKLYEVTSPDKHGQSLDAEFRPYQESLRIFLNYRSKLGTENSVQALTNTINQLKGSMKSLSVPDNSLKPLSDYFGSNTFLNVDDLHLMSLNGLDHIQLLKEKKYTWTMYISTALVFAFGLIQLAIGVIVLYLSTGFMTHFGSMLISEGISDMLYATSAYKSGYFSWDDYKRHKIQSLILSAVTVGVGAILSWGVRYSRFGYKLCGPALQETCGKELLKKTGYTVVVKSISTEALKGIAICAANYGADALIERHLKTFCENIGSAILSNIQSEVDNYKVSSRLEMVYKMHGESKAKRAIAEITEKFFNTHNLSDKLLATTLRISSSIMKGVKEAANKKNQSSSAILLTVSVVNKILVWSNRVKDLHMITTITKDLMDNLCKEIDEKLINAQEMYSTEMTFSQEEYEDFKKEITANWKHILRQQAGRVISQNIISPLLEDCLNMLITFCGKKVKEAYRWGKDKRVESKLKKLQKQYQASKTKLVKEGHETEKAITDKYEKEVLKLFGETRNPKLLADMILEDVPMDLTCALASGPVIEALLKERGIVVPGLCIVFNTGEGIKEEVQIGPKCEIKQVVEIDLKSNHYQISGINDLSQDDFEGSQNDCLYQALATVIPELRTLGPDNFRNEIARQIIENPKIQHHIQNGWHKYPIRLNLFGGAKKARKKVSRREDPESSDHQIKEAADHIFDRFIRVFRLAGTVQRISRDTDIPRETILQEGASEYQDRRSNLGTRFHSAHIIRCVIDNSIDPHQHAEAFVELTNILGHTQIVPKFVNEYHGIGGVIDRIQADALNMASFCDFSSSTPADEDIFNNIKNSFVDNIRKFLNNAERLTESDRIDIENGLNKICKTTHKDMFNSGRGGFFGRFRDAYM